LRDDGVDGLIAALNRRVDDLIRSAISEPPDQPR
jgi:hypothetical protein